MFNQINLASSEKYLLHINWPSFSLIDLEEVYRRNNEMRNLVFKENESITFIIA